MAAIKATVAGFMETAGIANEQVARDTMKGESLTLKQRIQRKDFPDRWTKREVMLLRYIAYYEQLPPGVINPLLNQANTDLLISKECGTELSVDAPVKGSKKRPRADPVPSKNDPGKRARSEKSTAEQEALDARIIDPSELKLGGTVEKSKVFSLFVRFVVSPTPFKEIFNAFGTEINKDFFRLLQVLLRIADKIKVRRELIAPDQVLSEDELKAFMYYKEALTCADRRRIIDSVTKFIQWARPRVGVAQEIL